MKCLNKVILLLILSIVTILTYKVLKNDHVKQSIKICCVVCGTERIHEALTMIKSALLYKTENKIEFFILTEVPLFNLLKENLNKLKLQKDFNFHLKQIEFPNEENEKESWKDLFKPCASQRLFLPSLLATINHILYVDIDVIFLSSPSDVFENFKDFKQQQHSGMVQESENTNLAWYPRFSLHPFYGEFGLNSGVMLMKLEDMRKSSWEKEIKDAHRNYSKQIVYGDQDLINVYFHHHPKEVDVIPCEYNYRSDHCMNYNDFCVAKDGVKILHGSRGMFHSNEQPIFKQIYSMFQKFEINDNTKNRKVFSKTLIEIENSKSEANCNRLSHKILLNLKRSLFDQN